MPCIFLPTPNWLAYNMLGIVHNWKYSKFSTAFYKRKALLNAAFHMGQCLHLHVHLNLCLQSWRLTGKVCMCMLVWKRMFKSSRSCSLWKLLLGREHSNGYVLRMLKGTRNLKHNLARVLLILKLLLWQSLWCSRRDFGLCCFLLSLPLHLIVNIFMEVSEWLRWMAR